MNAPIVASTNEPALLSTTPDNGASGVPINGNLSATFSKAMNPASLNTTTFTLMIYAVRMQF